MWIYYPVINDIFIQVDVDNELGHVGYINMEGTVIPSTSYQPSGTITMGGTSIPGSSVPVAGGGTLSGTASLAGTIGIITGSGGMELSDASQGTATTCSFQPSGGIVLSGRALRSYFWHYGFWSTYGWWHSYFGWWGMPRTQTRTIIR